MEVMSENDTSDLFIGMGDIDFSINSAFGLYRNVLIRSARLSFNYNSTDKRPTWVSRGLYGDGFDYRA